MNLKIFIKRILRFVIDKLSDILKMKNIIIFESYPDYSDNTKNVFDEMLNRHINETYKMIWACDNSNSAASLNELFKDVSNVSAISASSYKFKYYYRKRAKAFVVCNALPAKAKKEQYYCNLAHGCALKNATDYSLPEMCYDADVMTISNYMAPYDAHNLSCESSNMRPLGYARNDNLFSEINLQQLFGKPSIKKHIYWLPTYRQQRFGASVHSDISMPILYTEREARILNDCAKKNETLIIVKVHPAQDLSKVNEYDLSNVLFIKNDFFNDKDFTNYNLLGSSDAMISDYSSVYYDYLLCDKPIGLCFDDFEEYNKREGFTLDPNFILKGGEKLYNIDDLCAFVESVANGEDKLASERNEIKNLVHDHIDDKSTERIVDYLIIKIESVK